ncbi:KptA family-domain-containing protein [Roridomyces roridus]|uniref:2'-phosphotransferase n=1 Tax=Roridomyces roridus TaxID=1738132 RepID=A0AAD7CD99_9AGAR|nr:KptA family-domain-containing protein [Roridomyces roridus]
MEASSTPAESSRARKKPSKPKTGENKPQPGSSKLRGLDKDSPEVRTSKTLSWLLRHGAKSEGLAMRPDGYVKVADLLANSRLASLNLEALQAIVKADLKQRYDLLFEEESGIWWMKANQGHSIKSVKLDLAPISCVSDIPSGIAVHGTTKKAWESIATQGLSKMKRNHIHLAQGLAGDKVVSGMRGQSQILIFIDVQRAMDDGVKFFLSDNGVVLTEGNEKGILETRYFQRVETADRAPVPGWEEQSERVK